MVLPYCASCDALEKLLIKNRRLFKNLNDYKVFNLSGHDSKITKIDDIKSAIKDAAKNGRKTLT